MKYTEALSQLKQQEPGKLYIITGEEDFLADQIEQLLLRKLNPDNDTEAVQRFDEHATIDQLLESLDSSPFFSSQNIIIVDNPAFLSSGTSSTTDEAKILAYLPQIPEYSTLIIRARNKIDKRKKLGKELARLGMMIECDTIPHWQIDEWLQRRLNQLQLRLDREAYLYLSEVIKSMETISLGFIEQELQKLKLYQNEGVISRTVIEEILSTVPEVSAFRLWDAISQHQLDTALELYFAQQRAGVHPLKLLGLLNRQVSQLWEVKLYLAKRMTAKQIAQQLKLHPFIAEKIVAQAKSFTLAKIETMLINLAKADYQLKTGSTPPALLEQLIIEFMQQE